MNPREVVPPAIVVAILLFAGFAERALDPTPIARAGLAVLAALAAPVGLAFAGRARPGARALVAMLALGGAVGAAALLPGILAPHAVESVTPSILVACGLAAGAAAGAALALWPRRKTRSSGEP